MLTKMQRFKTSSAESVALFLFAHQDDEFGVFQVIVDEVNKGREIHCAYLTNGAFGDVSPLRRNQESLNVLSKLGVPKNNVIFVGLNLQISDGYLPSNLAACATWIHEWLRSFEDIKAIYVPAWEGGHQDHDALHAVTVCTAQDRNVLQCVRQFPLYNSYCCPGKFFRVFHPISQNGEVINKKISFNARFRFLGFCLSYPSQVKTWIGLFPFVMISYLTSGSQKLQTVSIARIHQRPHAGKLYYERRGFFTWEEMSTNLAVWRSSRCVVFNS
jgi:hypothetical protein